jgi:hypothetical protein
MGRMPLGAELFHDRLHLGTFQVRHTQQQPANIAGLGIPAACLWKHSIFFATALTVECRFYSPEDPKCESLPGRKFVQFYFFWRTPVHRV